MGHGLTDAITYDSPILVPDDGDALVAVSIVPGIQQLANRTAYLYNWNGTLGTSVSANTAAIATHTTQLQLMPYGLLMGASRMSCAPGSNALSVGRIHTLVNGNGRLHDPNAVASASGLTTVTPTGLTPSSWYYLYVTAAASSASPPPAQYEWWATPPDDSLIAMTGDTTRRYIGCFLTDTSSNIIPFTMARGRYVWRRSAGVVGAFRVTTPGTTSYSVLPLAPTGGIRLVPPHARQVDLFVRIDGSASNSAVRFVTENDTGEATEVFAGASPNSATISLDMGATQTVRYQTLNATDVAYVYVAGFQEG
ncbi:MAG: hypothetical protein JO152_09995 [Mycobacteriaceae bacterium]|nr:hypothetical protein [Mycobacteriaceae bacterium]